MSPSQPSASPALQGVCYVNMNSTPQSFADRSKTEWKPAESSLDLRRLKSSDLFDGKTEIVIDHAGSLYRLKITRQGKLILNK